MGFRKASLGGYSSSSNEDYSSDTYTQSSFDDDSANGDELLARLSPIDFFAHTQSLGGDKSHWVDPKDRNVGERVRKEARAFILKADDRAYAFWQVFKAVYADDLEQDAWAGTVYYDGESTTVGMLVAKLEQALEMARPRTSEGFYDRQLDLLLEYKKFQPVKKYLDRVYKEFSEKQVYFRHLSFEEQDRIVEERRLHRAAQHYTEKQIRLLPEWDNLGEILFGTKDPLTQEMITTWLCGAVKRALNPGCYMKRALIIKGDQDAGKSAFVSRLAKFWGTELPSGTSDMDFVRFCTRTWIMELAECDRLFKGKEASILKQQLSTTVDKYTPKYKEADEMSVTPRVTVFIGTTNKSQFLVDDTGNKRYWVIDMADNWKLPLAWLDKNVDQLWATAYHKLLNGHPTDLSEDSQVASEVRNREYMVEGSWNEQLETTLAKATFEGKQHIAFKAVDIMYAMGLKGEAHSKNKTAVVNSLKQLGYEQKPIKVLGKTEKLWKLTKVSNSDVSPARIDIERGVWTYLDKDNPDKGYR
ncbi:MAG: VapE family protein [Nostoc sp. DedQUE05]|uniref:VapE domain-containing protein n=1 Tax=Nostoc sp. DedQUE05 TaxID=3075391 RepID=UPI002AD386B2|nr:VapE domain-containing protein [Nostoc sp. DedQUE05]MDZ8090460.1 VapE family protein [Nostoc sp. DedQUE05]